MTLKERFGPFLKMWCARNGMVLANYSNGDRKARLRDYVRLKARAVSCKIPRTGAN